ncbi:enoyl-[acyl-carrier-protein] reductase, mitochondrial [Hetaerina americana]|uniref:enoyl-[acyl-carrier-protein] reductase, mitochondrial n=1 Tax=Hetaerina americana TaxID=62018 RepID=UPI003A7F5A47
MNFFIKVLSVGQKSKLQTVRHQSTKAYKLIYSEYGDPAKVVKLEEESIPPPQSGEVLVKMLAAPVNPADINTIQGVYPVKPKLPAIGGNEGVGVVEEVGEGVKKVKKGDWVLPRDTGWGTWRSHAVSKEKNFIKIPSTIGVVNAATLAVNPCTAYRMLKDFAPLKPSETVIQNGANSAAGQCVIQLCKAWGIHSINVVRDRPDIDDLKKYLHSIGATHVLTESEIRTTEIFKSGQVPKPKLAFNCVGGKSSLELMRHLDFQGWMITYGGMSREPITVPTSSLIFKDICLRGFWMTRWCSLNSASKKREDMILELADMVSRGQLRAPAHTLMPLAQYKETLEQSFSVKGFAGKKYIIDFQA